MHYRNLLALFLVAVIAIAVTAVFFSIGSGAGKIEQVDQSGPHLQGGARTFKEELQIENGSRVSVSDSASEATGSVQISRFPARFSGDWQIDESALFRFDFLGPGPTISRQASIGEEIELLAGEWRVVSLSETWAPVAANLSVYEEIETTVFVSKRVSWAVRVIDENATPISRVEIQWIPEGEVERANVLPKELIEQESGVFEMNTLAVPGELRVEAQGFLAASRVLNGVATQDAVVTIELEQAGEHLIQVVSATTGEAVLTGEVISAEGVKYELVNGEVLLPSNRGPGPFIVESRGFLSSQGMRLRGGGESRVRLFPGREVRVTTIGSESRAAIPGAIIMLDLELGGSGPESQSVRQEHRSDASGELTLFLPENASVAILGFDLRRELASELVSLSGTIPPELELPLSKRAPLIVSVEGESGELLAESGSATYFGKEYAIGLDKGRLRFPLPQLCTGGKIASKHGRFALVRSGEEGERPEFCSGEFSIFLPVGRVTRARALDGRGRALSKVPLTLSFDISSASEAAFNLHPSLFGLTPTGHPAWHIQPSLKPKMTAVTDENGFFGFDGQAGTYRVTVSTLFGGHRIPEILGEGYATSSVLCPSIGEEVVVDTPISCLVTALDRSTGMPLDEVEVFLPVSWGQGVSVSKSGQSGAVWSGWVDSGSIDSVHVSSPGWYPAKPKWDESSAGSSKAGVAYLERAAAATFFVELPSGVVDAPVVQLDFLTDSQTSSKGQVLWQERLDTGEAGRFDLLLPRRSCKLTMSVSRGAENLTLENEELQVEEGGVYKIVLLRGP